MACGSADCACLAARMPLIVRSLISFTVGFECVTRCGGIIYVVCMPVLKGLDRFYSCSVCCTRECDEREQTLLDICWT